MIEKNLSVVDSRLLLTLFGANDQHLKKIRKSLGTAVSIAARDNQVHIKGEPLAVEQATQVLEQLREIAHRTGSLEPEDVNQVIHQVTGLGAADRAQTIDVLQVGRKVEPKSPGQAAFIKAMTEHDMVFCVGPAGTGKTYLAVAKAVASLRSEQVKKIVLVRPAVEAGESLGFLPGDLQAKIHPYLRPLLDALRELLDYDQVKRYTEQDLIEVLPLAYMRGRTLNEAFIILDEAQNTSVAQMKMFLTRMGHGSKIIVCGDTTQIDLGPKMHSGLVDAVRRLQNVPGIGWVQMTKVDIVRHPLVQRIVRAYEEEGR